MGFNYNDFLNVGKLVENKISTNLSRFLSSSFKEDIGGVDLKLNLTFDVKQAKKIRRSDVGPSYTRTWIEYKNVQGKLGSICKENLDFFIIETIDAWVIKSREDALLLFKTKCKIDSNQYKELKLLSPNIQIDLNQPYQRQGRKDVIMLVEINDPLWPNKLSIPKTEITL